MHPSAYDALAERYNRDKAEDRAFLANVMGCRKEGDEQFEAEDFLPKQEDEDSGWDLQIACMEAMAARWGGLPEGYDGRN